MLLSTLLLSGAGCSARPVAPAVSTDEVSSATTELASAPEPVDPSRVDDSLSGTILHAYRNDALKFSTSYPSDLVPTVSGNTVYFSATDGPGYWYEITVSPTSAKDSAEWLKSQTPAATPLYLVGTDTQQKTVFAARGVPYNSDTTDENGRPIYVTEIKAVLVRDGMAYVIPMGQASSGTTSPTIDAQTMRFVEDVSVDVPPMSPEDQAWDNANRSLAQFLGLLHEHTYAAAGGQYGGDFSQLREWNPTADPNDVATLWKDGCEINGLLCMHVASITPVSNDANRVLTFNVAFTKDDGKPYAKDGKTAFPFVVRAGSDGMYYVETMPLYQQ